jgi:hypothetical protein
MEAHWKALIAEQLIRARRRRGRAGPAGSGHGQLDQQAVGRLSRQDALLNQSMARATQARRDARRRALQAALERIG